MNLSILLFAENVQIWKNKEKFPQCLKGNRKRAKKVEKNISFYFDESKHILVKMLTFPILAQCYVDLPRLAQFFQQRRALRAKVFAWPLGM